MEANSTSSENIEENMPKEEMEKTIKLIENAGVTQLLNDNIIIFLGITGSGKSTAVQYLADNPELRSVEMDDGRYQIIDNNRIGSNDTIASKTLYPELTYDPVTKAAYYDCSGFKDTRSANYDMASNYLTKRVLDYATGIKIIFVVDADHMKRNGDRSGFTDFLSNAVQLLNDIDKFSDSIGLLVTKVEKYRGRKVLSEETLVNALKSFMVKVYNDLSKVVDEEHILSKTRKLLEILLKEGHLSLFYAPDEEGQINEIPLLEDGKTPIRNMINGLNYAPITSTDFSYTISDKSKNYVYKLNHEITKYISDKLEELTKQTLQFQEDEITKAVNLMQMQEKLRDRVVYLQYILHELKDEQRIHILFSKYLEVLDKLQMTVAPNILDAIYNFIKYTLFLNDLNKNMIVTANGQEWKDEIRAVEEKNLECHNWLHFLNDIREFTSSYSWQEKKNNEEFYTPIENSTLHTFIRNLQKMDFNGYDTFHNMDITHEKLNMLNDILISAKSNSSHEIDGSTLTVKGAHVQLSDVVKLVDPNIRDIHIFATDRVYLNADLVAQGVNVAIIARIWEVIGDRKITLDGYNGFSFNIPPAARTEIYSTGFNGNTGLRGRDAGDFLGISAKILNESALTISGIGGTGGNGQDGGRGGPGISGSIPTVSKYYEEKRCIQNSNLFSLHLSFNDWSSKGFFCDNNLFTYETRGPNGTPGGRGGSGGAGGCGGHRGGVSLIDFSSDHEPLIKLQLKNGAAGASGNGGAAGAHGLTYRVTVKCRENDCIFSWDDSYIEDLSIEPFQTFQTFTGREDYLVGRSGEIPKCEYDEPKNYTGIEWLVNEFLNYTADAIDNNRFERPALLEFIAKIKSRNLVRDNAIFQIFENGDQNRSDTKISYQLLQEKILDIESNHTVEEPRAKRSIPPQFNFDSYVPLIHLNNSHVQNVTSKIPKLEFSQTTPQKMYSSEPNWNGSLALIDLLIRKITKRNHKLLTGGDGSIDEREAQAIAMNIISEFESNVDVDEIQDYNPVELQTQLFKSIMTNNNLNQVENILSNLSESITIKNRLN